VSFIRSCTKDYVRAFSLIKKTRQQLEQSVGQYCGLQLPGPIDEDGNAMKIILISDKEGVAQGFKAKYEFIKRTNSSERTFNLNLM